MKSEYILMIIGYVLVINAIGFLSMFIDKIRAKKGKWRIKEWTLISIAILGGGIGSLIGMYKFRHKTKKPRFYIGIPTIVIFEIVMIFYCLIAKPFAF